MRLGAGHVIDLVAIAAFTLLAALDKVPAAVTASVVTMIVAARFRPPVDYPKPPSSTGRSLRPPGATVRPPPAASSPSSDGSIVSFARAAWCFLKREVNWIK
ncbi:MAG: hypothetical protein KF718_16855 [Polyangiaceae bacterium]|nr:hypothetical protein [Polyangiaceae bacterium]